MYVLYTRYMSRLFNNAYVFDNITKQWSVEFVFIRHYTVVQFIIPNIFISEMNSKSYSDVECNVYKTTFPC